MTRVVNTVVLAGLGVCGVILVRRILQSSGDPLAGSRWDGGSRSRSTVHRWRSRRRAGGPNRSRSWATPSRSSSVPAPGGKGTELAARLRHSGASGPVNAASRIKGETLPCRVSARHSPRRVESCSAQTRASRTSTCSHTSCPARATRGISPRRDSTMIPTSRVRPRGCGYPWPSARGVNLHEAGSTRNEL